MTTTRATHRKAAIAAFVAVLVGVPGVRSAEAEPAEPGGWKTKTIEVDSPYVDSAPVEVHRAWCYGSAPIDGTEPPQASDVKCRLVTKGTARWTGTMRGEATFELDTWADEKDPGRLLYEGFGDQGNRFVDVFIEGCGRGGFHMEEWDGYVDYSLGAYDAENDNAPGYNKWRVRPGSGTGDLVGLSGEGENHWTSHSPFHPKEHGNHGEGVFTGVFRCRVPASEAGLAASSPPEPAKVTAASAASGTTAARPSVQAPSPPAPASRPPQVDVASATSELAGAASPHGQMRTSSLSSTGARARSFLGFAALFVLVGLIFRAAAWRIVR